ncbi:MAG: sensor histidine kinase [Caballeronia sp.]|uniref:PAS domain-containing protein n=1 Tax=Caballeronia sp. TaxID=1931223 RepID=UPI002614FA27|nr:PAS domain-containing protein [Caballeronia sp.]MDB5833272.1 sensor histidine kinase [Caballeronia sp.]
MLTVLIPRSSRGAALSIAIAGASAAAGLLEPITGCLSLVLVVLFTHFFGRSLGRLSAGFTSLGIAAAMLASSHPPLASDSVSRCAIALVAIAAAWLCAELVSRRPRRPGSTARLKDDPFDLPIDQLSRNIWSRTVEGELEYVSQSVMDYSGQTFEQLRWPYTLTHPDDVAIPAQAFQRAKETGEAQEFQCRYRSRAGNYEWFAAVLHTQRDQNNEVSRVYGMHWNINKQKNEEEQLRERNQTLQSVSNLFPGHAWTVLPNGSIEYLSPSLCEYTGIKEVHSYDIFRAAIHPDDHQANDRYWDALVSGNDEGELEFRLRRSDGIYRWFLCRVKAIRSDSGRLLRWVVVSWDIHDRKTAEFFLRAEEETYRRIVDSVPACVYVGGPTGELLYVNKVGVANLGRPLEEIVGDGWMTSIHPDDVQAARQQWNASIAACEPVVLAVRMLQHDGVYRWQHLLAEPSRCSNGDVINWYLIGIEIEETIKAQQALAASEREARELLDRLPGRFATRTEQDFDYINQEILDEAGTTLEGMQNLGFLHFIHPDDRDRIKAGYLRSVQEKSTFDTTYRWADHGCEYRWRHSRSVPYFNDNGSVYKWYAVNMDIDDLYKSKEVVREREVQLNWLAETVPSLLWRTDSHGRLEYVNKRTEDYTGLRLDDLIANGWLHLVHPDDYASTIEAWRDSLDSGKPYDCVLRLRSIDNTYRWFQCKGTPMRGANGEIVNWYGLSTDIHERQLAQEALRNEEFNLRRLVDALPAMIWRATPQGDVDRWNPQMLTFMGKSGQEFDREMLLNLIPEADRLRVRSRWRGAVQEGVSYQDTYQVIGADGKLHWYLARGEPFRDKSGQILHWYGVCTDINDLKQTEAALEQRELQLRKLIETIPAMLWCNDPQGRLIYINQKTSDFLGLGISQLAGLSYQRAIHPDDLGSLLQAWTRSVETGEPYSHVARLRRRDGVYRWYQHTAEAMRDADGNIVQWYGLCLDIDEPKRAEDRLKQAQAELARATRIATVAELSASIAHELNQPLTSVIANAQACKRWLAASPPNLSEARASVESVVRDARSADETMLSIRALFKRQTFKKRERNVKDMVLEAVRLLREDETRRTADIDLDLPDGLPPVFVDQIQIQQVLLNLITNGIEAAENTGRVPRIVIAASPFDNQSVLLEVIDNGSGIVGGDSIFDAFVTTKNKGMGIGLAVSRSIIEAHEGRLTASNNEGYGATFSVVLPVLPVQVSQLEVGAK